RQIVVVILVAEKWLPVAEGQKKFLVEIARVAGPFHIDEAELSRVSSLVQICTRHGVGVIPAASSGSGNKLISTTAIRRNHGGTHLVGPIHFGGNQLPVPVDKFGNTAIVDDVHRRHFSFAHAQHGPGGAAVISDRAEGAAWRQFDKHWRNSQREISRAA